MRTIRLLIEYDGTAYHGWQVQKEGLTIQGILQECVLKVTGTNSPVIGAGRTDAGVHALGQVASFRTESELDAMTLRRALNAVLPPDIRLLGAAEADFSFHPRNDAVGKTYYYIVANQRTVSPFLSRYVWLVPQKIDIAHMQSAALALPGRHDFSSFMGSGSDVTDAVRELRIARLETLDRIEFMTTPLSGNFIKFTFEARGFLRHMVRNIVGTLIEMGRGRIAFTEMAAIIKARDRRQAGQNAPAKGLFLEKIEY